jgi:endonuclease YncB( thermonuclease family)
MLVGANMVGLSQPATQSPGAVWEVRIKGVYDGDTIRFEAPSLPTPLDAMKVRVRGIDTPELGPKAKCQSENNRAAAAKARLVQLIGKATTAQLTNFEWDKYGGRVVADVKVNGVDVRNIMITEGFAAPYTGKGPKTDWCKK